LPPRASLAKEEICPVSGACVAPGRRSTGRGTATTAITSALLLEPLAADEGAAVLVMGTGAGIGVAGGAAGVGAVDEVGAEAVEGDVDDAGAVGAVGATAAAALVGPGEAVDADAEAD
jgi:hypothetical protein